MILIDPKYINAYSDLSKILCLLKEYDEAIQLLNQAIVLDPDDVKLYNSKGFTLNECGKT